MCSNAVTPPAFQFSLVDWMHRVLPDNYILGSPRGAGMVSPTAQGIYLTLLGWASEFDWVLPRDEPDLRKLINATQEEWDAAKAEVFDPLNAITEIERPVHCMVVDPEGYKKFEPEDRDGWDA